MGETTRKSDNLSRIRITLTERDKHCGDCAVCNLNLFYEQAFQIPQYGDGHVSRRNFV